MTTEINSILTAIKNDDLVSFFKHIKNNENVCFGRFPLLSLCYLYNAKKIIKNYKLQILKLKYYNIVEEPYEVYIKFREVAGRALRLYLSDNAIVSPIEMLAILNKDNKVKSMYLTYTKLNIMTDKILKNITKIYLISSQDAVVKKNRLRISPKKLSKKDKFYFKLATSLSLVFVMFLSSIVLLLTSTVGLGTSFNPYKIYNNTQLINALSTGGNYVLASDLTLNSSVDIDFKGVLDGNNHKLTIASESSASLISTNSGTIKNIVLEYGDISREISSSMSLLVNNNNGTIDNVSINVNSISITCKKNATDIFVTALSTKNTGTISNCNVTINGTISTTGDGECFVSSVTGTNTGTISGCNFGGSLSTSEADVSAICAYNELNATISNCINNASITQNSVLNGWSPNVAGIVLNNYGNVDKCINNGALTAISNNETDNAEGYIFLGGISANNYGTHSHCLNNGKLTANTKKIMVYCGGITAYSSYWVNNNQYIYPTLNKCGVNSTIDITSDDEKAYVFGGGLGGFTCGTISGCYSLATFTKVHDGEKYFLGSTLGNAYAQYNIFYDRYFIDITLSNNYVLRSDDVPYHLGSLISNGRLVDNGSNVSPGITSTGESEIKNTEVYFNE